jgi:hypothetical protein
MFCYLRSDALLLSEFIYYFFLQTANKFFFPVSEWGNIPECMSCENCVQLVLLPFVFDQGKNFVCVEESV